MANHIISTASNDNVFPIWIKETGVKGGRPAVADRRILIKGKANVANPKTLITPRGVVTTVSDEELVELKKIKAFNAMVRDGFYVIEAGKKPVVEEVVKDMTKKDKSAQPTPADFKDKKGPKVKTPKGGVDDPTEKDPSATSEDAE